MVNTRLGGEIVKRKIILCTLLCLLPLCAHAQVWRMESYPQEELDAYSFHAEFVSGVTVSGEIPSQFVLINTFDFNGHYLHLNRSDDVQQWESLSAFQVPPGFTAEVNAADSDHCSLTLLSASEKRTYHFHYVPVPEAGDWQLERYSIERPGFSFEGRVAGFWRMEMTQTENGQTRQMNAAWYWQNACFNLLLHELPHSIADAQRLQSERPVAAIAPSNPRDQVNMREGPSTRHPRMGRLCSGTMVRIEGSAEEEWLYILPMGGAAQRAYVKKDLLAFGAEIWNVPDASYERILFAKGRDEVPTSNLPYHGRYQTYHYPSGTHVRVIGRYNDEWAIVSFGTGAFYAETKYLKEP